ncbi:MAG TPA: GGDEF domain-containing protein [Gaiellaceae bacterium]
MPSVALEVLRICQDPESDISDLSERLSRDPILASKVLQMANSAYYNRGNEVTSINRAAVMLGLRTLKVLALGFTLVQDLPNSGEAGGFDLQVFWHRSLVNAVAARSIAESIRSTKTEEAFLCGLLSQIGKLALAQAAPERYCVAVARGNGWPSEELEQEVLGCTSSVVGELLLAEWHVPPSIVRGATYALRADDLPPDAPREWRELAGITALAIRAGDIIFTDTGGVGLLALNDEAERSFGLHAETVSEILEGLHDGVLESAEAFAVELPPGRSYQQIIHEAHAQLMSVSLNTVIDLEQTASALAELAGENEILHVRALTDKLTQLANRTALEEVLTREIHQRFRTEIEEDALGVIMIDIDKFKSVNDKYGHAAGDDVLREVSATMATVTRKADLLARYGGEEFCVVMPHTTHAGITAAAERFRRAVEESPIVLESGVRLDVTISVGAASSACITDLQAGKRLIEVADAALYRAKENGRNRAEIEPRGKTRRWRA